MFHHDLTMTGAELVSLSEVGVAVAVAAVMLCISEVLMKTVVARGPG